jgi:hypothetical protein
MRFCLSKMLERDRNITASGLVRQKAIADSKKINW